jgi:hypothetical protein
MCISPKALSTSSPLRIRKSRRHHRGTHLFCCPKKSPSQQSFPDPSPKNIYFLVHPCCWSSHTGEMEKRRDAVLWIEAGGLMQCGATQRQAYARPGGGLAWRGVVSSKGVRRETQRDGGRRRCSQHLHQVSSPSTPCARSICATLAPSFGCVWLLM